MWFFHFRHWTTCIFDDAALDAAPFPLSIFQCCKLTIVGTLSLYCTFVLDDGLAKYNPFTVSLCLIDGITLAGRHLSRHSHRWKSFSPFLWLHLIRCFSLSFEKICNERRNVWLVAFLCVLIGFGMECRLSFPFDTCNPVPVLFLVWVEACHF